MSELEFEFNESYGDPLVGAYRCFDPRLNYIVFSGYGETKELAKSDYFKNQPKFINQPGAIDLKPIA